jgi:hypothetical protein
MHLRQRDPTTKRTGGTLAQSESIGPVFAPWQMARAFASTDRLTREGVSVRAAQAVSIASFRACQTWRGRDGGGRRLRRQLASPKGSLRTPAGKSAALLLAADAEMRRVKGVTMETGMQFRKIDSWLSSSTARAFIMK